MNERLKLIRKNKGATQEKFAEMFGMTRSYIAQIEAGDKIPSDRFVREICRQLDVSEDWLRTGKGEPYIPKTRNELIASFLNDVMEEEPDSVRRRWIEAFSSLPVEAWELFDRLAVEYVEKKKD